MSKHLAEKYFFSKFVILIFFFDRLELRSFGTKWKIISLADTWYLMVSIHAEVLELLVFMILVYYELMLHQAELVTLRMILFLLGLRCCQHLSNQ